METTNIDQAILAKSEAEKVVNEILGVIEEKRKQGIKILMLTPWFGLKTYDSKDYFAVIKLLKASNVKFYEEQHGINIFSHPYVATIMIPGPEPEPVEKPEKELTAQINDIPVEVFAGGTEATPEAGLSVQVGQIAVPLDSFFGTGEALPEVVNQSSDERMEARGQNQPDNLPEPKTAPKKVKAKAQLSSESPIDLAKSSVKDLSSQFDDLLDDSRDQEINQIKSTLELLEKADKIIEADWDGQHENLKAHARKIATLYARIQNLRVDAEAGLTARTYKFLSTGQGKDLKQYEYKDRLAQFVLWEQKLLSKIDGLLKSMSKQADIVLTLISTSRTEMSLSINNIGGQA